MKLTKDHTFSIVFLSIILSSLLANVGVPQSSLSNDMFVLIMPMIIGIISIVLFFLLNWGMPDSKLGIAIFLVVFNISLAIIIRLIHES